MSYLLLLKESLFSRRAGNIAASPDTLVSQAQTPQPLTQGDFDAGAAHMDQFVDGVQWETLLVDLACFNDGPEYSAQARF